MGVLAISGAGLYGVGADPSILKAEGLTAFPVSGDFESIAKVTLATSAASITFSDIPQGYKHLQVRGMFNCSTATNPYIRIGSGSIDSGANYAWHHLWGNGTSANSNQGSNQTYMFCNYNPSSSYFSTQVTDVLDYSSTAKNATIRTFAGSDTNGGTSEVAVWSGHWRNTAGVTHLQIAGATFLQYTTAALYGIRG